MMIKVLNGYELYLVVLTSGISVYAYYSFCEDWSLSQGIRRISKAALALFTGLVLGTAVHLLRLSIGLGSISTAISSMVSFFQINGLQAVSNFDNQSIVYLFQQLDHTSMTYHQVKDWLWVLSLRFCVMLSVIAFVIALLYKLIK